MTKFTSATVTDKSWTTAAASKHQLKILLDFMSLIASLDAEESQVVCDQLIIDLQVRNKEQIGVHTALVSQVKGDTLSEGGNDSNDTVETAILAAGDNDGADTRYSIKESKVCTFKPSDHEDTQPWYCRIRMDLSKVMRQAIKNELLDKSTRRDIYAVVVFTNTTGILNPSDCEVTVTRTFKYQLIDRNVQSKLL